MPTRWTPLRKLLHTPYWLLLAFYHAIFAPPGTSRQMRAVIALLWATGRKQVSMGDAANMWDQIRDSEVNNTAAVPPPIPEALRDEVNIHELTKGLLIHGDKLEQPWQVFFIRSERTMRTIHSGQQDGAPKGRPIIYFPGGAYLRGPIELHFLFCYTICQLTKSDIYFFKYPVIPEHTASTVVPAIVNYLSMIKSAFGSPPPGSVEFTWADCQPAHVLHELGRPADGLVIMGDSAGGGLALTVAIELAKLKENKPDVRELVLIAPWTDVSCSAKGVEEVEKVDPMHVVFPSYFVLTVSSADLSIFGGVRRLRVAGATVCGLVWSSAATSPTQASSSALSILQQPIPSPKFADFSVLSPTTRISVIVGSYDILMKDNEEFVERYKGIVQDEWCEEVKEKEAKEKRKRIEMKVWKGGVHCFPLIPWAPEAKEAREWIRQRVVS